VTLFGTTYRLTPLNIVCILAVLLPFYVFFADITSSSPEGWGYLAFILFVPPAVLGLIVDFAIQRFSRRYLWTFLLECALLIPLILFLGQRGGTRTFVVPEGMEKRFVVTMYGAGGAPATANGFFHWNVTVDVPQNGIVLTSTRFGDNQSETRWVTASGRRIDNSISSPDLYVALMPRDTIHCPSGYYVYETWCLMSKAWSDPPKMREIDSIRSFLTNYICKR